MPGMPGRTRYFFRRVGDVFPQDSALARVAWSLMAIRSDLTTELGLIGRDDGELRALFSSEFLGRMYFFRGSLRSLYSAHVQLWSLLCQVVEFHEVAEGCGRWDEFLEHISRVHEYADEFRGYRNRFGGHVEGSVAQSLRHADPDAVVALGFNEFATLGNEFGEAAFFSALAAEAGVPQSDEGFEHLLHRMRDASVACLRCIDLALAIFATRYPLFR